MFKIGFKAVSIKYDEPDSLIFGALLSPCLSLSLSEKKVLLLQCQVRQRYLFVDGYESVRYDASTKHGNDGTARHDG